MYVPARATGVQRPGDGALDDGVVTPYEVTATRDEAIVLAAILQ